MKMAPSLHRLCLVLVLALVIPLAVSEGELSLSHESLAETVTTVESLMGAPEPICPNVTNPALMTEIRLRAYFYVYGAYKPDGTLIGSDWGNQMVATLDGGGGEYVVGVKTCVYELLAAITFFTNLGRTFGPYGGGANSAYPCTFSNATAGQGMTDFVAERVSDHVGHFALSSFTPIYSDVIVPVCPPTPIAVPWPVSRSNHTSVSVSIYFNSDCTDQRMSGNLINDYSVCQDFQSGGLRFFIQIGCFPNGTAYATGYGQHVDTLCSGSFKNSWGKIESGVCTVSPPEMYYRSIKATCNAPPPPPPPVTLVPLQITLPTPAPTPTRPPSLPAQPPTSPPTSSTTPPNSAPSSSTSSLLLFIQSLSVWLLFFVR